MLRRNPDFLDMSDVIETFDKDETSRLLDAQLDALHNDSCEGMIDNFHILYARFKAISESQSVESDTLDEITELFQDICEIFINHIAEQFNITVDEKYIEDHRKEIHNTAFLLYLFFVLDLRSNLFHVLVSFIGEHVDDIAKQFEGLRARKDSITEVNRSMENQNIALICSNIYDVIDWVFETMEPELFFECLEAGYVAKGPMQNLYETGVIDGGFMDVIRDILKENLALKGKIGFDIICRLKGLRFDD